MKNIHLLLYKKNSSYCDLRSKFHKTLFTDICYLLLQLDRDLMSGTLTKIIENNVV